MGAAQSRQSRAETLFSAEDLEEEEGDDSHSDKRDYRHPNSSQQVASAALSRLWTQRPILERVPVKTLHC